MRSTSIVPRLRAAINSVNQRRPAGVLTSTVLGQKCSSGQSIRKLHDSSLSEDAYQGDNEFILSILQAHPSTRDSRGYISSFAPPVQRPSFSSPLLPPTAPDQPTSTTTPVPTASPQPSNPIVSSLLNPRIRRPALVKIQGPFTDSQLNSIARGMAHLQKLGLVSVIVMDRDDIPLTEPSDTASASRQRTLILRDVERLVHFLWKARAAARPILSTVARMTPVESSGFDEAGIEGGGDEIYVEEEGLDHVRRAVTEGEIPVLLPVALDPTCRSRRIGSDKVLIALAQAMSSTGTTDGYIYPPPTSSPSSSSQISTSESPDQTQTSLPLPKPSSIDITPMRLLIINREGGIPSYARSGLPHLSINLSSEYDYIQSTFLPQWKDSHPTSLANLTLAHGCLEYMPREASALIVSHRSPAAMIGNLITNKPAHSASLPHALLVESEGRITRDTPTLIRKGLPVRILRSMEEVDKTKLTNLLEKSFKRVLDADKFYARLKEDLDFVIVIGDYAGAAVVTKEEGQGEGNETICYLDKFAVLPSHQGDGTVDFLWVALRDETYGLGLLDAANPSIGSLSGKGQGKDLVWRSRADNPVNKWYFERSNGFSLTPDGRWKMFWCDAEQRLREKAREKGREFGGGRLIRVVEDDERGRLERWAPVIAGIKSAWK